MERAEKIELKNRIEIVKQRIYKACEFYVGYLSKGEKRTLKDYCDFKDAVKAFSEDETIGGNLNHSYNTGDNILMYNSLKYHHNLAVRNAVRKMRNEFKRDVIDPEEMINYRDERAERLIAKVENYANQLRNANFSINGYNSQAISGCSELINSYIRGVLAKDLTTLENCGFPDPEEAIRGIASQYGKVSKNINRR